MRLYVLVEGPSEERFVEEVLEPHLRDRSVWVFMQTVETSRDAAGRKRRGGGRWKHWLRDLKRLTGQSGDDARFTTMFDLYGLPDDFPELAQHATERDTRVRADALETAMARVVDDRRFIPNLMRHEFEALVLASLDELAKVLDPNELSGIAPLQALLRSAPPEDVDDGRTTAPSKRLLAHLPTYRKTVHGPLAIAATGLAKLRQACPRFDAWVKKLEALGGTEP